MKNDTLRKCYNCFVYKPLATEFYRKLSGYQYRCKGCNAEIKRAYNKQSAQKKIKARWDVIFGRAI